MTERGFDELVAEAASASVEGWDFSWLDGRATEARPSWGFSRALGYRMAGVQSSLDLQTGGGEVLAQVPSVPRLAVATESWAPNLQKAQRLLGPRGIVVVNAAEEPPLPFADDTFDLISSRHPVRVWWDEIARVLAPGGSYFAQHVGPHSVFEVVEWFLGPQPEEVRQMRAPEADRVAAAEAGLEVVDLRYEETRMEFFDIGAVVYFLRKVIWIVPGFTVEAHLPRLRDLHEKITADGPFVAYSTRFLIEARKPAA
ncbi:methyltransferase domain-containing protein [Frondihabitans australicus]|uniref:Methyltransferase family protein n=1 Tax=Frondihabitans australicus TaxID=386892 RepID=A0A495IJ10_9MICO|nr:methyltransferase domain-containing protein [Frondihabitans australicus]RKR76012.1 methyltransferase family protein [Frondihabitans australicus]